MVFLRNLNVKPPKNNILRQLGVKTVTSNEQNCTENKLYAILSDKTKLVFQGHWEQGPTFPFTYID